MKKSSRYYYNIYMIFYSIITIFSKSFQKKFTALYSTHLQIDRLIYNNITNILKKLFTYTVAGELWAVFFKKIKNNNNVFIQREKKNLIVYKTFCLFYKNKINHYNELNIKHQFSKTIANFYNDIKIKSYRNKNFNLVIFYYFNKIILTNYPYFYWAYFNVYSKYINNTNENSKSKHTKSQLFFIYINSIKKFYKQKTKTSFDKTNLKLFRGVKNFFKNTVNKKPISVVSTKKLLTIVKIQNKKAPYSFVEHNFLKKYNQMFNKLKIQYKFYINNILYNNLVLKSLNNFLKTKTKFLKITWYNKVHNSIIDIKKKNIVLFLRSAKQFNKGRYSRNRQLYRTGVYWCIWLNVVIVYSLYYYFYRVVFSFGYLWLPLGLMMLTMFSSRLYKYRYYDTNQIYIELVEFNNFIYTNVINVKLIWKQKAIFFFSKVKVFLVNFFFLVKLRFFL